MSKGQSTIEYAVLICVVVAALVAMQVYFKRAVQGRLRNSADQVSEGYAYSPGATLGDSIVTKSSEELASEYAIDGGGEKLNVSDYELTQTQISLRNEEVLSFASEPAR